jgi:hypothetical protein
MGREMRCFIGLGDPAMHGRNALFRVPTRAGDVYMCVSRSNFWNEKRAVVEVDRARFFELWQREPDGIHATYANGSPRTWMEDPKFELAAEGFSFGQSDPVPLAEVNCLPCNTAGNKDSYIALCDGVARTIWLATYAADYFPVECSAESAATLHRLAGVPGSHWRTVEDLIPPQ